MLFKKKIVFSPPCRDITQLCEMKPRACFSEMPAKFYLQSLSYRWPCHRQKDSKWDLRVWPEVCIPAAGRNRGFGLYAGSPALVTSEGRARRKSYIGHLDTTTTSILKCLEIADYTVFSTCSCQLHLTEFSFLADLCYICLFQRPGSLE